MKLYRLEQYQECYTLYKDLLKNTQVKIQKEEKSILLLDLKISKKHLILSKCNLCYQVEFWQWNIFSVCLWIHSEVHSVSWQVFQSFRFIKSIGEEMHLKCKVTHYYYSCSTLFNLYLMLGTWVIVLHFERFFCNNKKKAVSWILFLYCRMNLMLSARPTWQPWWLHCKCGMCRMW